MAQLFANAASGVLSVAIAAADTSISISTGGSLFPVANTGVATIGPSADWFKAVLQDTSGIEVVYIRTHTSGSNSFADVIRGQDGTTARSFSVGSVLGLRVTAADMSALQPESAQTLTNKTITAVALKETRVAMGANSVDLATGNYFSKTIAGATTLTVANVPAAGIAASFLLDLTNGGSAAITWWTGVKWVGGTAPTLTTAGRDVLGFFTHDAGATWTGLVLGKDVK